jgi:hypothetical protein
MHYTAYLFRAYHLHEELLAPPFTRRAGAGVHGGTVPDGMR